MKSQLSAVQLRLVLSIIITLLFCLGLGIFIFGYGILSDIAKDTSLKATEAKQGDDGVQKMVKTQKDLASNSDAIARTSLIVSESKSYQYQDQLISDLNLYAQKSDITITDISFSTSTGPAKSAGTQPVLAGGIKPTIASVTIRSPVPYKNMMNFIYLIEQSLTKMRISTITLSRSTDQNTSSGEVTSDILNIEVYLR